MTRFESNEVVSYNRWHFTKDVERGDAEIYRDQWVSEIVFTAPQILLMGHSRATKNLRSCVHRAIYYKTFALMLATRRRSFQANHRYLTVVALEGVE